MVDYKYIKKGDDEKSIIVLLETVDSYFDYDHNNVTKFINSLQVFSKKIRVLPHTDKSGNFTIPLQLLAPYSLDQACDLLERAIDIKTKLVHLETKEEANARDIISKEEAIQRTELAISAFVARSQYLDQSSDDANYLLVNKNTKQLDIYTRCLDCLQSSILESFESKIHFNLAKQETEKKITDLNDQDRLNLITQAIKIINPNSKLSLSFDAEKNIVINFDTENLGLKTLLDYLSQLDKDLIQLYRNTNDVIIQSYEQVMLIKNTLEQVDDIEEEAIEINPADEDVNVLTDGEGEEVDAPLEGLENNPIDEQETSDNDETIDVGNDSNNDSSDSNVVHEVAKPKKEHNKNKKPENPIPVLKLTPTEKERLDIQNLNYRAIKLGCIIGATVTVAVGSTLLIYFVGPVVAPVIAAKMTVAKSALATFAASNKIAMAIDMVLCNIASIAASAYNLLHLSAVINPVIGLLSTLIAGCAKLIANLALLGNASPAAVAIKSVFVSGFSGIVSGLITKASVELYDDYKTSNDDKTLPKPA